MMTAEEIALANLTKSIPSAVLAEIETAVQTIIDTKDEYRRIQPYYTRWRVHYEAPALREKTGRAGAALQDIRRHGLAKGIDVTPLYRSLFA